MAAITPVRVTDQHGLRIAGYRVHHVREAYFLHYHAARLGRYPTLWAAVAAAEHHARER
jgi:hypothetical protein